MISPELILFDLDGTLIDTAPDMAAALNDVLRAEGREALPFASIRPHVSHGAAGLLRLAFGEHLPVHELDRLRAAFLERYQRDLSGASRLFPGMAEVLDRIEATGLRWGVVTNKPGWLTEPLLRALDLDARAATVVSGDTLSQRKPDPAPLLFACSSVGIAPDRTLYVGDAERDMIAATAAGMATCLALYGYLGTDDPSDHWGADIAIERPDELWPRLTAQTAAEVP